MPQSELDRVTWNKMGHRKIYISQLTSDLFSVLGEDGSEYTENQPNG